MKTRKLRVWATVQLDLLVPEDMEDQQAVDELFAETTYTFEETENIIIDDTELIEIADDSPWEAEDDEPDLDDQFYAAIQVDDITEEEFNNMSLEQQHALLEKFHNQR